MRYNLATLAVIVVALTATAAVGQETSPVASVLPNPTFPYSPPEAWHHHSSTALEGALRGTAVLTRAQGEKNLLDSQAALVGEYAREKYLDNRVKFVEDQFQIKEIKYKYRELERQRAVARRIKGKELKPLRDQEVAKSYQLTKFEFNPSTGAIYWPTSLASPRYAAYRHRISMLLEQMVQYNVASDQFYREELARVCDSLGNQLRQEANDLGIVRHAEYQDAVRFIAGLKYTPHLLSPPQGPLVAMNN